MMQVQVSFARTDPFASELLKLAYSSALMPHTLLVGLPRKHICLIYCRDFCELSDTVVHGPLCLCYGSGKQDNNRNSCPRYAKPLHTRPPLPHPNAVWGDSIAHLYFRHNDKPMALISGALKYKFETTMSFRPFRPFNTAPDASSQPG